MKEYYETIDEAIEAVKNAEWTNGMATDNATVERECCYLKVMRKCGSDTHPEILRFEIVPKNFLTPQTSNIQEDIKDALGLYGDIHLQFQDDNVCVVGL